MPTGRLPGSCSRWWLRALLSALYFPGCPQETFKCGNGKCIPKSQRCDGQDSCGDGSDEATCDRGKARPSPWRFRGLSSRPEEAALSNPHAADPEFNKQTTLWDVWRERASVRGDPSRRWRTGAGLEGRGAGSGVAGWGRPRPGASVGGSQARMETAEGLIFSLPPPRAVSVVTCTKHTYRCHSGLCVSKSNPECDGVKDCSDGSDEKNCGEQDWAGGHPRRRESRQRLPHPLLPWCEDAGCLEERATVLIC